MLCGACRGGGMPPQTPGATEERRPPLPSSPSDTPSRSTTPATVSPRRTSTSPRGSRVTVRSSAVDGDRETTVFAGPQTIWTAARGWCPGNVGSPEVESGIGRAGRWIVGPPSKRRAGIALSPPIAGLSSKSERRSRPAMADQDAHEPALGDSVRLPEDFPVAWEQPGDENLHGHYDADRFFLRANGPCTRVGMAHGPTYWEGP